MLEIGIHKAGSLHMWRQFFGKEVKIYAFDIRPECVENAYGVADEAKVGSQTDTNFLSEISRDWGPFDLIIDDGSHRSEHILKTMDVLFEHLSPGGAYVVEDVFTSFWKTYGGGLCNPNSFIEKTKGMIDRMYCRYMGEKYSKHHVISAEEVPRHTPLSKNVDSIQFFSSGIICYRKKAVES
jgi:hypothetical protein